MERLAVITLILLNLGCSQSFEDIFEKLPVEEQPVVEVDTTKQLKNFAVFYGWPGSTNSADLAWELNAVSEFYKQYDLVVFGAGLEDPSHGDHINTKTIINNIKNEVDVFSYISIGNTYSYTMTELKQMADQWKTNHGVKGVLLDEAGFDFWSGTDSEMRQRQIEIVDYIHSLGMDIIFNAWDPDDLFIKEDSNPLTINSSDYYLYESYIIKEDGALDFSDYRAKINKMQAAKQNYNIGLLGLSTTSQPISSFSQDDLNLLAVAAIADNLDGVSWGTNNFSATDSIMPYRDFNNYKSFVNVKNVTANDPLISFEHKLGSCVVDYSNLNFSCY